MLSKLFSSKKDRKLAIEDPFLFELLQHFAILTRTQNDMILDLQKRVSTLEASLEQDIHKPE